MQIDTRMGARMHACYAVACCNCRPESLPFSLCFHFRRKGFFSSYSISERDIPQSRSSRSLIATS
ncbi:hypothetical protein GA0061098_100433 [Bradyrhizobium shewense]|uniref:Uncharacterized protein n=1 Tax=Bradyrhizobium shewense TaxID=1761772 RepID=A0A1C3VCH9_9BRAD|nr:hypothetical protein GA0061098_100433 [Bradyrhizobium shewense]